MKTCSTCQTQLDDEAKFCSKCGTPVQAARAPACAVCGFKFKDDANFCPMCGNPRETPADSGPPKAQPPRAAPQTPKAPAVPPPPPAAALGHVLELPKGVVKITSDMVKLPANFKGRIVIPEGVKIIEDRCFEGRAITGVSFPKSLREIGLWAFKECQLKELRIEGESESEKVVINDVAFMGNSELSAISLDNCDVQNTVFQGCPITRITLKGNNSLAGGILGFVIKLEQCRIYDNDFIDTVNDIYGGAPGTYILKGRLARSNFKKTQGDENFTFKECTECTVYKDKTKRCYTLEGLEDGRVLFPEFKWEMV